MIPEHIVTYLIYAHAGFGLIALSIGLIALSTRKGRKVHRMTGKVFVVSMFLSSVISVIVAVQPEHENSFLLCIGIMTIYMVVTGYRCLSYKSIQHNYLLDYIFTTIVFVSSLFMILYVPIAYGKIHPLFTIFGALGLTLTVQDFFLYRNKEKLRKGYLKMHIGKITGAYIASVTAFIVVNWEFGIYGWVAPGIIGSFYMAYWNKRLKEGTL